MPTAASSSARPTRPATASVCTGCRANTRPPAAAAAGDNADARSSATSTDATACHSAFIDRKSTRLNSSHSQISYAVFCLKKKKIPATHLAATLRTQLDHLLVPDL